MPLTSIMNRENAGVPARYARVFLIALLGFGVLWEVARAYWDIRSCNPKGYDDDHFMGYCGLKSQVDYEHGAYFFGSEPAAIQALRRADVLFIGSSRLQFGLSTDAVRDFFHRSQLKHYLYRPA